MDQQALTVVLTIITTLVGFITAGIWWWVNNLWGMVREQQKELTELTVNMARNYVPRGELQDTFKSIFEKLDEIQRDVRIRP